MVNHASLRDLEDAQDTESRIARRRIELAEKAIGYYRSRIHQVQESFYAVAAREGIADDPRFREELLRVSECVGENVGNVVRKIGELEDDYDEMRRRHGEDREQFIGNQQNTG